LLVEGCCSLKGSSTESSKTTSFSSDFAMQTPSENTKKIFLN